MRNHMQSVGREGRAMDQHEAASASPSTIAALQQIWAEALAVDVVAPDADFFDLGGDSVTATTIMVHIEERWEILLDPVEAFDRPVLKDLALLVDETIAAAAVERSQMTARRSEAT